MFDRNSAFQQTTDVYLRELLKLFFNSKKKKRDSRLWSPFGVVVSAYLYIPYSQIAVSVKQGFNHISTPSQPLGC